MAVWLRLMFLSTLRNLISPIYLPPFLRLRFLIQLLKIFGLLLFGFGILVALFPFHTWAARGYDAAPTPVSMLHAGVLKKFGLYGLIQIAVPLLPDAAFSWSPWLMWLALGNIVLVGMVAVAQTNFKSMVSYGSIMHMGYCFWELGYVLH